MQISMDGVAYIVYRDGRVYDTRSKNWLYGVTSVQFGVTIDRLEPVTAPVVKTSHHNPLEREGKYQRLDDHQIAKIREMIDRGDSISAIAEEMKVPRNVVYNIKSGKTYRGRG